MGNQGSATDRGRRTVVLIVLLEVVFIAFLVSRALTDDGGYRLWAAIGAAGLTVLTATVAWTRLRR